MLRPRKSLGLEIANEGVTLALLSRGKTLRVEGSESAPLSPGTVQLSRREPNVLDPQRFVAQVREAHLRLQSRERSVSVSLPDATGRLVLLDLEARFKSREEGMEILRWKLKKSLPFDMSTVHLDYQLLAEKENGAVSLLVALISRPVVTQYEELLIQAGLEPRYLDFTSLNLYRLFAPRLEMSDNGAFVTFYRGAITVLIFYGGVLSFYRSKETVGEVQNLFREVNSSFLVYQDRHPGQAVTEVFCMAPPSEAETFRHLVAEASGLEPVLLDLERTVELERGGDAGAVHTLAGALGAAARSL